MGTVEILLSEEDHERLRNEYEAQTTRALPVGIGLPPSFEQWLGERVAKNTETSSAIEAEDMHIFNAIEKLVTNLPRYGFGLAHIVPQGMKRSESVRNLAQPVARDFKSQAHYAKRIEDLFEHYTKDAKDIADLAQLGLTNRACDALNDAYRHLVERTTKAAPGLDPERAIGRVEGAAAILVSLDVLSRDAAQERANVFKLYARNLPKGTWVNKIFGGSDKEI
jgi:hypothetical protein